MKQIKTLNKVYHQKLSVEEAYQLLFNVKVKLKQTHFVKVKFRFKDHPIFTGIFSLFTILPIPAGLIKFFIKRKSLDNDFITNKDLIQLITSKHVYIEVDSKDAYIKIKTI